MSNNIVEQISFATGFIYAKTVKVRDNILSLISNRKILQEEGYPGEVKNRTTGLSNEDMEKEIEKIEELMRI